MDSDERAMSRKKKTTAFETVVNQTSFQLLAYEL
jgi:hypothetical protein